MKNAIQKIIIVAAVVAGVSQVANAAGYMVRIEDNIYAATNYPEYTAGVSDDERARYAIAAAEFLCTNAGNTYLECTDTMGRDPQIFRRSNFSDFLLSDENERRYIYAFARFRNGSRHEVRAENVGDAVLRLVDRCDGASVRQNCEVDVLNTGWICGDGDGFDIVEAAPAPVTQNCNTEATSSNFDNIDRPNMCPDGQVWDNTGCLWATAEVCSAMPIPQIFVNDSEVGNDDLGGSCSLPREDNDCITLYGDTQPVFAADEDDRCEPIPNCGTGTTGTANAQNECECLDDTYRFVAGSTTMCAPIPPGAAICGANAINAEDITMCVCVDDHRFVAGSTTICEPIPPDAANCGANAINDPNDNTICVCVDNHRFVEGSATECEAIPQTSGGGNGSGGKFILSGIGLFWAVYSWKNGAGEFNFSPDVGYAFTESGYSANAAGQLNFRDENLHIYWRAGQQNANGNFGDLRYESGGKYTADFWTATFSESISGETANYDFSLSANLRGEIWKISPVYRLHSEWKESDSGIKTDTQNELNLQGNFRYNGWTIRPAAGFRWENFGDFANSGKFQINAIHRF